MHRSPSRLLRPYVCNACKLRQAILVSNTTIRPLRNLHGSTRARLQSTSQDVKFVEKRIRELGGPEQVHRYFPRWQASRDTKLLSANQLKERFASLKAGESQDDSALSVYGRISSRRKSSSTLWFLDLESGQASVQVLLNTGKLLEATPELDEQTIRDVRSNFRRGDWLVVTGIPHRTESGELSVKATSLPQTVAPSLQPIPEKLLDAEFVSRNRHVDRIVHDSSRDVILLRDKLVTRLRQFLQDRDYVEVNTPLLVAEAGGAVARPFETYATEFRETKLNLRVAPELFLKRLIVGNLERVFEIGSSFRNEGVDATHNPEFSTCEFYSAMTTLPELIELTEALFHNLASVADVARRSLESVPEVDLLAYQGPFRQLDFIPDLEKAIRQKIPSWQFPNLSLEDALNNILDTFSQTSIEPPADATLPRLLDDLAAHFLEPQCVAPTWIINHPECMSPLAKSFEAGPSAISGVQHRVSARAELFIGHREYVNCYEEENSPLEQRRKFGEQIAMKRTPGATSQDSSAQTAARKQHAEPAETHGVVDESYVSALEYGMPPTGGWGCGIDRIVMLFAGKSRIADVLPFGTLTNVVALASTNKAKAKTVK